ncbi:RNA polymerase sigma-70 factor [Catalinimonas alkaloidigena]|nr:RNA polymerase sigma-70 factor [Catalinimonas alkaloidigena]
MTDWLTRIAHQSDRQAFKQLFDLHFHGLHAFALHLVKNREVAEEVVSDVFTKVWVNRATLLQVRDVKAYLYTSVRNQGLNQLALRHHQMQTRTTDLTFDLAADKSLGPERTLLYQEMEQEVQKAIGQLPERCRLIFQMVRQEGFSYKEAAEILGISVKTVDNQLTIATRKLAESLRPYLVQRQLAH